jgi:hypothetical protein
LLFVLLIKVISAEIDDTYITNELSKMYLSDFAYLRTLSETKPNMPSGYESMEGWNCHMKRG